VYRGIGEIEDLFIALVDFELTFFARCSEAIAATVNGQINFIVDIIILFF
jgi:hypothetical protein